jgi:hypothetical protein
MTTLRTATGTPQAPKRRACQGADTPKKPRTGEAPFIDLRTEEALEEARLLAARLSFEMTTGDLIKAGLKSRMIRREVSVGRLMHRAWEAFEAKDFEKAFALLREAAAKSDRHASKQDYKDAKDAVAKRELATRVEELVEMMVAMMDLKGLDGLVEEEVLVEAAAQAQALEATIGAKIKASLDAIVAQLEGRWGKRGNAHKAIESFLIKGEEPKLLGLAKKERLFELGEVEVYGRKRVTVAVRFFLPRSLNDEDNGAVGANAILYEKAAEAADGEWVPIAGSPVNKKFAATTDRYRLLNAAVNYDPDVKAHLRELLLGRFGATSPWHEALSAGKYKVVPIGHVQEHGASGFVLYQLATVVDEGMMTAELADKMAKIKANMTAGAKAGEAPRYFTISASGRA